MFSAYLKDGSVKKILIDTELAKSLVKISSFRFEKIRNDKPTEENAFFIVENAYEAVKELVDALMILDGYKSYSHEANIDFLKEFYLHELPMSFITKIDRYRKLRNDIKYRGIIPSRGEGQAAIEEMKEVFDLLNVMIRRKIRQ